METKEFISSQVKKASYSKESQVLVVTFNNDKDYQYSDVPEEKWEEMKVAESVGKFLNSQIKGKYPYIPLVKDESK